MTWVKLEDTFPDHPKVLEVGDQAAWLFVASLCYSARHLTDGFLPSRAIGKLTGLSKPSQLESRLVAAGMWHETEGGLLIHDYANHQRTREQVTEARAAATRRQSRKRHGVTSSEVTRPEKTREEKTVPPAPLPGGVRCDFEVFGPEVARLKAELAESDEETG